MSLYATCGSGESFLFLRSDILDVVPDERPRGKRRIEASAVPEMDARARDAKAALHGRLGA